MNDLRFSVSMCVYGGDKAEYFDEALASVYNQTLVPDEVVLTVDGPVSEDINGVIDKYQQAHGMKVVRLSQNMGHGTARRTGFANCQFKLIAIADADDINAPNRFEKQIDCFKRNPELSAVSSGCYHFENTISETQYEELLPTTDAEIKKMMKTRCPLTQACVMLKKEDVEKAGGYLDWYHAEDYYLWIRMALNDVKFANVNESLLYVRSNDSYISRRGGKKYFNSLKRLFRYMLDHEMIGWGTYFYNISTRYVAQVVLTGKTRAILRKLIK